MLSKSNTKRLKTLQCLVIYAAVIAKVFYFMQFVYFFFCFNRFGIGTIYSKQERFQLAEIHFRHALKINRKNSVILVHIGVMQFYLNKREQAIQTLMEAIKLDPKNPLCKFHHASMNFNIGKLQEALEELEELKQLVPKESVVYYLIGKIHKQLGNIDLALMHFSWATDLGNFNLILYSYQ